MQNSPLALLLLIGVSAYVIKLWFDDFRMARRGAPNPRAFPGAVPAPTGALVIGAVGAAVILAGETWGELRLGLSDQQSNLTLLFAGYTLLAAFVEEIIFRGYIVIENRGSGVKWLSILGASVLFAALHPFLWDWKEGHVLWQLNEKAWFSTAAVFCSSLWFYTVRFASFNPGRSLLPCFAAHLTKNLGVIAIKGLQGHLLGLF